MATVTVKVERGDNVAQFPQVFKELGTGAMTAAMNIVQGALQRNAPVNVGTFRGSFANAVEVKAVLITGSAFSQDNPIKAEVIEEGRRPGRYAPVAAITRWVQLVIRPPAEQLRSVAFLVNRAIARRGITGKHVFARSFKETELAVRRILGEELPAALAKRL